MSRAEDGEGLTTTDWARYAGLLGLATLLFLAVFGSRQGAFVSLIAVYLVLAAVGLIVVQLRMDRS